MDTQPATDGKIDAEASEWLVRLLDLEPDPDEPYFQPEDRQAAFYRWLSQSHRHLEGFLEVAETFRKLGNIDPHQRLPLQLPTTPEAPANVVPLKRPMVGTMFTPSPIHPSEPGASRLPNKSALYSRLAGWPWAATGALAFLILLPLGFQHLSAASRQYATGIGERLFVPLEDGSEIQLNTHSSVSVKFTPHAREVRLSQGEALFNVVHDAHRPFTVLTDDVTIRDVGTKFAVYCPSAGETRIAVIEGRVAVSRTGAPAGDRGLLALPEGTDTESNHDSSAAFTLLDAGKMAQMSHHGRTSTLRVSTVSAHELARQMSWREGLLIFEGQTLAHAIGEFNRYNRRQLVIDDHDIANLQLGGTFLSTDPDTFAATVAKVLDVSVLPAGPNSETIHLARIR